MTWARFDDDFPQHPKIVGLSDQAFRLHVSAVCYANQKLSDGAIQESVLTILLPGAGRAAVKRRALELADAGVWEKQPDGNYLIHDFLEYNPTREKVLGSRDELSRKRADAGRLGGRKSRETPKQNGSKHPSKTEANTQAKPKQNRSKTEANTQAKPKQNRSPVPDPVPQEGYDDDRERARSRGNGGPLDVAITALENLTGLVPKYVLDDVVETIDSGIPAEWFDPACQEAARQNVRTWAYVAGIMRHWRTHGRDCQCKRPSPPRAAKQGDDRDAAIAEEYTASRAAARKRA